MFDIPIFVSTILYLCYHVCIAKIDVNTYLCAWFLTYHQDIDWINSNVQCHTESFIDTESSIITLNNITHNAVL